MRRSLAGANLIRVEMVRIADAASYRPSCISFVTAMRYIRDEWNWCAIALRGSVPHSSPFGAPACGLFASRIGATGSLELPAV